MPGGAAATTFYDVVTRYRMENLAQGELDRYSNATARVDRRTRRMHRSTMMASRGFGILHRAMIPLTGGVVGVAAFGYATAKAFRNMNEEMNNSIALAGQLNLAFSFSQDPIENFTKSMMLSKSVFRDLVKDAAALPGELSDFLGMTRMISGSVFAAGGTPNFMREMVGKLALATPATGAGFSEVGLGAMQMLQGMARVTNPLFRMMKTTGLLPGITSTQEWNALPAAQQLRLLDEGLSKLVDNPMFRKNVLHTFDTQLGTLADSLFGIEGIAGRLGRDAFDGLLEGLTKLNEWLDENSDSIVQKARILGVNAVGLLGLTHAERQAFVGRDVMFPQKYGTFWDRAEEQQRQKQIDQLVHERAIRDLRRRMKMEGLTEQEITGLTVPGASAFGGYKRDERWLSTYRYFEQRARTELAGLMAREEKKPEAIPRELTDPAKVEQNFYIKLDVSTDESPETTAVRIRRAMEKAATHPTVTASATSLLPSASAIP